MIIQSKPILDSRNLAFGSASGGAGHKTIVDNRSSSEILARRIAV
jgi:hypothetical protein